MLEVKVEKCAGIDVGKKFLAVCVLIGLANQKPVGEIAESVSVPSEAPKPVGCDLPTINRLYLEDRPSKVLDTRLTADILLDHTLAKIGLLISLEQVCLRHRTRQHSAFVL